VVKNIVLLDLDQNAWFHDGIQLIKYGGIEKRAFLRRQG
jgi:hypothetical protein